MEMVTLAPCIYERYKLQTSLSEFAMILIILSSFSKIDRKHLRMQFSFAQPFCSEKLCSVLKLIAHIIFNKTHFYMVFCLNLFKLKGFFFSRKEI